MATITLRSGTELGDAMVAQRCIAGAPFRVDTARLPGRSSPAKGKAAVLGGGCVMQVDGILASKGREVRTIQPDATIGEAIGRLCAERVGALVVSEDGRRIAGIISDRGITWAIAERGAGVVKERCSTAIVTGKPFAGILHEAIEWAAELIVLGVHRGRPPSWASPAWSSSPAMTA